MADDLLRPLTEMERRRVAVNLAWVEGYLDGMRRGISARPEGKVDLDQIQASLGVVIGRVQEARLVLVPPKESSDD